MTLFRNKYRIESARLRGYDYARAGSYFITICTHNRVCWFGRVVNGQMILNEAGKIVADEWLRNPQIRPDMHIQQASFCVMPNHFHAILTFAGHAHIPSNPLNSFGPQHQNTASVIRGFKSVCTRRIKNTIDPNFAWQSRYWDHIIRNDDEYQRIEAYILDNPGRWDNDTFNRPQDSN